MARVVRASSSSAYRRVSTVPSVPRLSVPMPQSAAFSSASSNADGSASSGGSRVLLRVSSPVRANAIQREILRLVNQERQHAGIGPLQLQGQLQQSAQRYAEQMSAQNFFGHEDPQGKESIDRIRETGYVDPPCRCAWMYLTGENLAHGQETAAEVMRQWMASPGHRANILQEGFSEIGIGVFENYWVQHFGNVTVQ